MCGIAGIVSPGIDPLRREAATQRMLGAQRHRGPDEDGISTERNATLGMVRLAIIDPANGHQPMQSEDGRFTLVFNGAIYNYRALQAEFRHAGWNFRTNSDTEVLLAAYALRGADCLPLLRGMFAFAIWDAREQTLFAARDGLGIKPFYYARLESGGIAFASEINALLASGLVAREVDLAAAGEYLARLSVPSPRTIYQGIVNLPPGHCLRLSAEGRLKTEAWWHLPSAQTGTPRAANYAEFVQGLRAQLEETIRAHQVADVPVGAFLSGGMDSSAIVGLMTRSGAREMKTFSLVFDEPGFSEAADARLVADTFGTDHHEYCLTGKQLAVDLPRILQTLDQPTGDGINTYYASQMAHAGNVKVVLSGLGGDELFGSYPSFRDLPRLNALLPGWRCLPQTLQAATVGVLHGRPGARARKLADFLANARDLHELASLQRRVLPESVRLSLLAPEARSIVARLGPHHPMLDDFVADLLGADEHQIISAWEIRTYMADVLLRDSDVFSMAHSLELRVPLIDTQLLAWLWPQASYFKRDAAHPKRALADAVADLVPAAIRHRPKQGFALPFDRWMRKELRPFLDETFSSASLAACPWLDPRAVQAVWSDYQAGTDSRAWSRVWTIAVLIARLNRPVAVAA